jgi:hypothetical protein
MSDIYDESRLFKNDEPDRINPPESYTDIECSEFEDLVRIMLKKRNSSILLLDFANIITNEIKGHNMTTIILSYLLYKKSCLETSHLAKYLNSGDLKYIPQIPDRTLSKFRKTPDYTTL